MVSVWPNSNRAWRHGLHARARRPQRAYYCAGRTIVGGLVGGVHLDRLALTYRDYADTKKAKFRVNLTFCK